MAMETNWTEQLMVIVQQIVWKNAERPAKKNTSRPKYSTFTNGRAR